VSARHNWVPDDEESVMFRLTCIDLDNGEFAVYLNNHYLGSEDGSVEKLYLGDVLERLSRMPGVQLQTIQQPVPGDEEWCWNDVADSVLTPSHILRREMTVGGMLTRLQQYPQDALCTGTFWLEDDFLAVDGSLDSATIAAAMERAYYAHDANYGFNWDHLRLAINEVKDL